MMILLRSFAVASLTLQQLLWQLVIQLLPLFHIQFNGFRNLAAVCLEADIDIPQIQGIKEFLADPEKFAALAAPAASEDSPAEEAKEEAKKEESEDEESDDDMGFGLFD